MWPLPLFFTNKPTHAEVRKTVLAWKSQKDFQPVSSTMAYAKEHPDFITITCLEWKPVLANDLFKNIILDSLRFLSNEGRINVFAFVIMSNHLHMIWQICGEHSRAAVQRDFLKYTGQQILKHLRNDKVALLQGLFVGAKDRKHQVWERNALSIPLYSNWVFMQN